jgi:ubiquinone/menaquinone biosynthesis C-methylase UbiE
MPSIVFDQAAEYYDSTRGYPEGVPERIRDAIVATTEASEETRFLELGVGTGRIALPFIRAGYDFTGVDLSQPMMEQISRKLAADSQADNYRYRLLEADITHLPFDDDSFDVAMAVHVLHLVDGWQQAIREAYRVLRKPGGELLLGQDAAIEDAPPSAQRLVNARWDAILAELGVERDRLVPGAPGSRAAVIEPFLHELGAQTRSVTLVEHATLPLSPREMARRHKERQYSRDWMLPDDVHAEAVRRLDTWLRTECPEPDRPITATARFMALVARW